jgi:hypothetical protein
VSHPIALLRLGGDMKKAFLTGVALVILVMNARADELEDKIKAQTEAIRIDQILKTSQACALADSYQRMANDVVNMIAHLGGKVNSATMDVARNRQRTSDEYRAKCIGELGK